MSRGFGRGCPMARQLSDINSWSRKEQKAKKKKRTKRAISLPAGQSQPPWAKVELMLLMLPVPVHGRIFFSVFFTTFYGRANATWKILKKKKEQFVLCVTDQGHFYSAKRVLKLPWRRWIIISQRPSAIQSLSNDFFKRVFENGKE